uniref:Transmembrane protein 53 n=1 Tax=Ananas comosus var. bracteatus TaxID=296719 RepID=A0A6V7NWB7_ANACO|nr:unnamed protein product [Ananas comosus var. bracteatus]
MMCRSMRIRIYLRKEVIHGRMDGTVKWCPKMEASVRLLASAAALRRPIPLPPPPVLRSISLRNPNPKSLSHLPFSKSTERHFPFPSLPLLSFFLSLSPLPPLLRPLPVLLPLLPRTRPWLFPMGLLPDGSPQGHDLGFGGDRGATLTVVLLGWLGAEQRHLRKYAEIYNARGIRRCSSWFRSGSSQGLIFLRRLKDVFVDSGAAAEISPQVWAAGFCAALLKKRSSLTYSSGEAFEGSKQDVSLHKLNDESIRPSLGEIIIFSLLLKTFTFNLNDRVIPAESVENFVKEQKTLGRDVYAYNFGSSPHVDHFRSFPQLYTAKIDEFLKNL